MNSSTVIVSSNSLIIVVKVVALVIAYALRHFFIASSALEAFAKSGTLELKGVQSIEFAPLATWGQLFK